MPAIKRTTVSHPDFKSLVAELDAELWVRYPAIQQNFAQHNQMDERARVVVAYLDNKQIGCGCFRYMDEKTIEIKRMYVCPQARGQRIGEFILTELETWGVEEGFKHAKLETGLNQPEAISLYKRCGYQLIRNYPPYTHISESICMAKALA